MWIPKQWNDTQISEYGGQKNEKVDRKGGEKIQNDSLNDTPKAKNDTQAQNHNNI